MRRTEKYEKHKASPIKGTALSPGSLNTSPARARSALDCGSPLPLSLTTHAAISHFLQPGLEPSQRHSSILINSPEKRQRTAALKNTFHAFTHSRHAGKHSPQTFNSSRSNL
jgi:hypothetical protein